MFGIRKFVVGTGTAGLLAAGALLLFGQAGVAAVRSLDSSSSPAQVTIAAPSAACTAAIQAIKNAVVADRAEDAAERHLAKSEGLDPAADKAEDATEHANFKSLFAAARTACAPAAPPAVTLTRSPACTAAIQAFKAALAQGRPTTRAQWQQLQTLFGDVRTACGFTWSWDRR
jgi:hypothetical protein